MSFWSKSIEDIELTQNTDISLGLKTDEAKNRLDTYGENKLEAEKGRSKLAIFIAQFKDFLVLILMVASLVSIGLGEVLDGTIILIVVIINGIIGTVQESRANDALKALKEMSAPQAKILRDGEIIKVQSTKIVPGDVVLLEAGDYVPADVRIVESVNLKIDESALTGESVPVEKDAKTILPEDAGIGDRINCGFSSTVVTYGRGYGIVTTTGMKTEIGKIASMLNEVTEEITPLQKKLDAFGKILGIMCIVICAVIFGLGMLRQLDPLEMFMNAVGLAVAAIPEGLTVVVTVVLAMGMQKMVKRDAIIKRLSAVETLGSTTVICSDKTGTLTQNKMTVVSLYDGTKIWDVIGTGYSKEGGFEGINGDNTLSPSIEMFLKGAILCNDAKFKDSEKQIIGDPTEGALVVVAYKNGLNSETINKEYKRIEEIPFDSARKLMTTFHEHEGKTIAFTKGAPDVVLSRCTHIMKNGEIVPLTEEIKENITEQNIKYAKEALRVLSVSFKYVDTISEDVFSEEQNLVFLGLCGMIDPPRDEVRDSVALCKRAGIRVVMITGDHKITASAIGMNLGIIESEDEAMEGKEIDNLSDLELQQKLHTIHVFARVSPEHKVKLVEAVKRNGDIVAMTGDGVNDAPALKRADIGVAMGITGTDVTKEASDMILTDDNFSSIVDAVEEGRVIYSNIRKVVGYLLSCNIGEIILVFIATILQWPMPLLAIHLLSINLVTDAFPAFALGMEEKEDGIMDQKPRDPNESIVDKTMAWTVAIQSIALGLAGLASFGFAYFYEFAHLSSDIRIMSAQTYCFITIVIGELLRAYSNRSESRTLFKMKLFSNSFLNKCVVLSIVFLIAAIYVPAFNTIFKTIPLGLKDVEIALVLAIFPVIGGEFAKLIRKA